MTISIPVNPARRSAAAARFSIEQNTAVTEPQLRHALLGLRYPARPWQLVTWAEHNGAGNGLCRRLRELPDRAYRGPRDVHEELARSANTAYLAW
jgi:hypothetical protein